MKKIRQRIGDKLATMAGRKEVAELLIQKEAEKTGSKPR